MSTYYYSAITSAGERISGALDCADAGSAVAALASRELFVTNLVSRSDVRGALTAVTIRRPKRRGLIAFYRSFATLVSAGVPVRRALDAGIAQCTCGALRETLRAAAHDLDTGLALSEAFARRSHDVTELAVVMLRAGEAGGTLEDVLQRLALMLERQDAFRRKLAASLAYPAFVAVAAICLIVFLLSTIVPMFESLYGQLRVPLPAGTAVLLAAGDALRSGSAARALALLGLAAAAAVYCFRTRLRDAAASGAFFRIPLAGPIARKSALARASRMLGTLLRSGIPLVSAVEVTSGALGRGAFSVSLARVGAAVAQGIPLSQPLAADPLYDPLFLQLIQVGEEAGTLDAMLVKAADYYETDVEVALNAAAALIEPAMIVFLGAVVGAIVASILLPLYSMIGSIR